MITESSLKIRIVRRIEEIPIQDWNKVFPEAAGNYYFFKTLDESNLSRFSFFYILVYNNNIPVGAVNCFVMNFSFDVAVIGGLKTIISFIKNLVPSLLNPRVLICGLPMGQQGRLGMAAEPEIVLRAIYKGMEQIACQEKAGVIVFKDFDLSYRKIFDKYLDYSFFRIDSLPFCIMDINFASFDEYLKNLSGATRYDLRRKFKKVDGKVKIDFEVTNKPDESALDRIYALYLQICEKHKVGMEKVPIDFFRNISKNMLDEVRFFLWRIDDKIVAFSLCLVSGDCFNEYYVGFDYSVAYQYHLYFIIFRDLINWCIENKIKRYEIGPTGYEPKRRLNFTFVPLYVYVKHRNKFLNPIFKILSYLLLQNYIHFFKTGEVTTGEKITGQNGQILRGNPSLIPKTS